LTRSFSISMRAHVRTATRFVIAAAIGLLWITAAQAGPPDAPKASPLIPTMKAELDRSLKALSTQDPPAYFIGYTLTDTQRATVSGSNGALLSSDEGRNRWL
jgi:hypothetical protein